MAGFCPREGCEETTGGAMCAEHKRQHRVKVRRLRAGLGEAKRRAAVFAAMEAEVRRSGE